MAQIQHEICNERHNSLNYASSGANIKQHFYEKFQQFKIQQFQKSKKEHNRAIVKNIFVHVLTKNLLCDAFPLLSTRFLNYLNF